MSDELLILHPADAAGVDLDRLEQVLRDAALLGESFDFFGERHFRPGPGFERLLQVSASHRVVVLDDPTLPAISSSRAHLHLSLETSDAVQFVGSGLTEAPACRSCGVSFDDWTDRVGAWFETGQTEVRCDGCGTPGSLLDLDWHQAAGFARTTVRIWGVRPGELEPTRELHDLLHGVTGSAWASMFYRL